MVRGVQCGDCIAESPIIPGAAPEWLVVTQIVGDSDPNRNLSLVLPLNCTPDDISAAIQAAVTNHQLEINHLLAVRLAQQRKETLRLADIASAILTVYAASNDLPEHELCMLSELGLACDWSNGNSLPAMDQAAKHGRLPHHFHMAFTRSQFTAAAYSFLLFMEVNPTLAVQGGWQHSQTGVTEIRNFLNSPDSHPKLLDALVECISIGAPEANVALLIKLWGAAGESRPLVRRCLRGLAKNGALVGNLSTAQLIEMWEGLDEEDQRSKAHPTLLTQVISAIDDAGQIREFFLSQTFTVGQARLLTAAIASHPTIDTDFVKWIQAALDKVTPEQWASDLENTGPLQLLITVIVEQGGTLTLGVGYLDSLVGFAAKMARGNITNKFTSQEWDRFISVLSASLRVRFTERVLDDLLQLRGKIQDQVFDALGEKLVDLGALTRKDDVVPNLFSPLVEQRQVRGINWLCKVFDANAGGVDGFRNEESIDEFRIRIREALQNPGNSDFDVAMAELAKHWHKDGPTKG